MKVAKINNKIQTQTKINVQRIKNYLQQQQCCLKLRTLSQDVFYKIFPYGLTGPRELPNCVSGPDEDYSFKDAGYLKFYPEDEEKMKNMTPRERIDYKDVLIQQGKYIKD